MAHKLLDISPTPQVLVALTRTPIQPLDALSELIDNAIDSFRAGYIAGKPSPVRQVRIEVPGTTAVARGEGLIRVRDTGPGLTEEQIANAMRAGYSDKNHYDTLGLFGMGFNIATGKLGRQTCVISARAEDEHAIRVVLDLPMLLQAGTFEVSAERISKPFGLEHGTVVEIRGWWPDGDANSGFIRDLAKIPKKALSYRIGRRYATLLRGEAGEAVSISVNGNRCEAFEHCVWSESRFVERQKYGKISARISFDEEIDRSRRCLQDGTEFVGGVAACPRCGRSESREVIQRVRGWVGIQRYDDSNDFGIDLIRNGRAIRVSEKAAFFECADEETGRQEKEYPLDQQYGRIVGEVHLDQVPVDFQKQNFQLATAEWEAALRYLRGGSLLPSKWKPGEVNESPVSRLFQGYHKVRNFGRGDLYMGQYDPVRGKAARISREVEHDFYEKFLSKQPGYYDDAKWWELVETAGEAPVEKLPECGACGFQNPREREVCDSCGSVLVSKICLNNDCGKAIARSAVKCEHCGTSQIPKILVPWTCKFCSTANEEDDSNCRTCGGAKGAEHPASPQALAHGAVEQPELGASRLTITLANGKPTDPLRITVYAVQHSIVPSLGRPPIPMVLDAKADHLSLYADLAHPAFTALGLRPEYLIAAEAAQYLHTLHSSLRGNLGHTLAALTAELLREGWGDAVAENPDTVRAGIKELYNTITGRICDTPNAADFFSYLDEAQQSAMADTMIKSGVDLSELGRLKTSGSYLRYCDRETLAAYFGRYPADWFGGVVWLDRWPQEADLSAVVAIRLQAELRTKYLRCLEDCASYLRYEQPERLLVTRARAALEYLAGKLAP